MKNYGNDTEGSTKKAVDDIQSKVFHCCGADSYLDWTNGSLPNWKANTVPKSCCRNEKSCHFSAVKGHEKDIYTQVFYSIFHLLYFSYYSFWVVFIECEKHEMLALGKIFLKSTTIIKLL